MHQLPRLHKYTEVNCVVEVHRLFPESERYFLKSLSHCPPACARNFQLSVETKFGLLRIFAKCDHA